MADVAAAQAANYHDNNPEYGPKLTDWANEPRLCDLVTDFENAKQVQGVQITKINRWNDLLHVKGTAKPTKVKGRSGVQPKLIRRQAEWRYSALTEPFLASAKLFKISPVTFEDGKAARQNELVLNYQFRTQMNRVKFIDDFIRSTVDEGTSIVRVGWKRHTVKIKQEVPVYDHFAIEDEEQAQMLQQAIALKASDPHSFNDQAPPELKACVDYYEETGEATYAEDNGTVQVVEVEKIIENRPTAEVMNIANVFIDPTCNGDIDKAMFAICSFETCLADLKKEGKRYTNLDQVNFEGSSVLQQPDHQTQIPDPINLHDKARRKIVAYEYWGFYDIHGNDELIPFVATWIGKTLVRMELNPFPDGKLPFVLVPYLPVKRELYGEPDAELLEDNQAILGAVSRGLIDLLGRSANAQQGFAKGMLDPLNRRRYEDGKDYEFNPNVSPANGIVEHKYPDIPQSAMLMLNLQNQEAEALTGVKSFAGGMSGEAYGDVAAGIRGVLDAASKREMAILRRLAKGIMEVGQKICSMNAAFLSEEETIRITNTEFQTVRREDLAGNFDLEVDISTAEVDAKQAQDLAFMLQTLGNTVDMGITLMILSEIARLSKLPELAEKIAKFQPQPDPLAQEMQKLQIEELRFKVKKLMSEAELNDAKTDKTEAETDAVNLGFVEQETGTTHAREMEKQRGQAQGNMDLEVTKALLKTRKPEEKDGDVEAAIGYSRIANKQDNDSNVAPPVQAIPAPAASALPVDDIGGAGLPIGPEADQPLDPAMVTQPV
jgi:hypothetical protein